MATSFDFVLHHQYNELNAALFNNLLPRPTARNFKLMFNRGMTRSLGRCKWKAKYGVTVDQRDFAITISDTLRMGDQIRLRQVLLHEMIHLFMYVTDKGTAEAGHGPRWQRKWVEIGKAHDEHFGTVYMEKHARAQCSTQYANCREKTVRHAYAASPTSSAPVAPAQKLITKWTLTCPECGYVHHSKSLNGRIIKLAISTDGVRHGKGGTCHHRLTAVRNW